MLGTALGAALGAGVGAVAGTAAGAGIAGVVATGLGFGVGAAVSFARSAGASANAIASGANKSDPSFADLCNFIVASSVGPTIRKSRFSAPGVCDVTECFFAEQSCFAAKDYSGHIHRRRLPRVNPAMRPPNQKFAR
jgi:hypothetical protein